MKKQTKLPAWIQNRKLDFIEDDIVQEITKKEKHHIFRDEKWTFYKMLIRHKNIIRYATDNFNKIERLKREIQQSKEKIKKYNLESNTYWEHLSPFKEKYFFTCSTTSWVAEKKYRFYKININMKNQREPNVIYLGSEKKSVDYLLKTFPKRKKEIKTDWVAFVNKLTNDMREEPYKRIQQTILKNPTTFSKTKYEKEHFIF